MSRFRTASQQRKIAQAEASDSVEIMIGTHRLLSEDVTFKDLGLLIIDEEQRFYLESRGVPTEIAEALVVKGFFADVLQGLPSRSVAQAIDDRIEQLVALDKERF